MSPVGWVVGGNLQNDETLHVFRRTPLLPAYSIAPYMPQHTACLDAIAEAESPQSLTMELGNVRSRLINSESL
jgi:hypothetical protein